MTGMPLPQRNRFPATVLLPCNMARPLQPIGSIIETLIDKCQANPDRLAIEKNMVIMDGG
jgi:hypothetical protein